MSVLILGYGFSGYYCAKKLLAEGEEVIAISRSYPKEYQLKNLTHICADMRDFTLNFPVSTLIYCAPPPPKGVNDPLLAKTLVELERNNLIANIIYWGSSGVYGDHQGEWVDEKSECPISFETQRRRLDAEKQITDFAMKHDVNYTLMRVSGMFGPGRMPTNTASIICRKEAPFTNLVYIEDVAAIVAKIRKEKASVGVLNISDGIPKKTGDLQRLIAAYEGGVLKEQSYQEAITSVSPMRQFFLSTSKRLSNKKCLALFPETPFSNFEKSVRQCISNEPSEEQNSRPFGLNNNKDA